MLFGDEGWHICEYVRGFWCVKIVFGMGVVGSGVSVGDLRLLHLLAPPRCFGSPSVPRWRAF